MKNKIYNNKIHLCESCFNNVATCHSEVYFGDGIGNDNVCCCNAYIPLVTRHEYMDDRTRNITYDIAKRILDSQGEQE